MSLKQVEVSEGIVLLSGRLAPGVDVTSTVVYSGDNAFVFDTLHLPEDTRNLLQIIKGMGLTSVGLVNTHWHEDHVAGNQLFPQSTRIFSHALCVELMHTALPAQIENFNKSLREDERIVAVYPNGTVKDRSILSVGDREIELMHMPGHTPDSIIGYLKDEGIVIAGDTVIELPFVAYGDSLTLIDSLRSLSSLARVDTILQGHGGVCGREKLRSNIDYIESARRIVGEYVDSGKTLEQASSEISMSDCLSERADQVSRPYERIHASNIRKIFRELSETE